MKKIIVLIVLCFCFVSPAFAADITITGLTDAQANALVGQNMRQYVASYADWLLSEKAANEKYQLIKVLVAKTPEELTAAAKPILDAEKAKQLEAQPK